MSPGIQRRLCHLTFRGLFFTWDSEEVVSPGIQRRFFHLGFREGFVSWNLEEILFLEFRGGLVAWNLEYAVSPEIDKRVSFTPFQT